MSFEVSVVIPVYNAGKFLERSVRSALDQKEVKEVILVEDASTDNSYSVAQALALGDSRVKLHTHDGHKNKGAGASRNLALKLCSADFVSFLDADDQYLPDRFAETIKLFENQTVSAVYEPVACEFVDDHSRKEFCKMVKIPEDGAENYLSYPQKKLSGKTFFESLILEDNGFPMTDGITVRRSLILDTGFFNEDLRLHQDSEYWIRLAFNGHFATPEVTKPIARRTQHPGNRIVGRNAASKMKYYRSLRDWALKAKLESRLVAAIEKRMYFFEATSRFPGSTIIPKLVWRLNYFLKRTT